MEAAIVLAEKARPQTIRTIATGCKRLGPLKNAKPSALPMGRTVKALNTVWAVVRFGNTK